MAKTVLELHNLTKQFKTPSGVFTAVDHVSFSIKEGEIMGLLGPNGAGKTSTIQMLLDISTPTSGTIEYFGKNFWENREYCLSRIGFGSAYSHLQSKLTVFENLRIFAGLFAIKNSKARIEELLSVFNILDLSHQLYWKLSAGQQTRVNLVKALLHKPRLLLLDEPTASLDPEIAHVVVDLIQSLREKEGVSILYTSHNMSEVESLCDEVVFLDHGKVLTIDTPLGLTKRIGKAQLKITFDGPKKSVETVLKPLAYPYQFTREHVVHLEVEEADIPAILFKLGNKGIWLTDIAIEKPSLEDVFLTIARGTHQKDLKHTKPQQNL